MRQAMNNFPIPFEDHLETYSDAQNKTLKTRVRRLSYAIDLIWLAPSSARAILYYHQRFAKFLRGINFCRLFPQRINLKAQFVKPEEDVVEPDDERPIVYLDEARLEDSLGRLEWLFVGQLPPGLAGEIKRGTGIAVLTFFVIQLLRKMEQVEYAHGDLEFPINLLARVDNFISLRGKEWYGDTVLLDRFRALQLMMDVDGLNPDDSDKVAELVQKLRNEQLRSLVRTDYIVRLRIYELYHKVSPYILPRSGPHIAASMDRAELLANLDLLMDYVCGLDVFRQIRPDRRAQVREKIERRLARAIGTASDELGWHIYRGMRSRSGRSRFRTEYLFRNLLSDDQDRLAVLNRIYQHKKTDSDLSHPDYQRLPQLTLEKYQPFFSQRIAFDEVTDTFSFAEKPIEIDLGSSA